MDTPLRKLLALTGMAVSFVLVADGLAMLLPGPSSALGGAALVAVGGCGLRFGLPRFLSPAGRPFGPILAARFGMFALPVLCAPIAWLWHVTSPEALTAGFAVAWLGVWTTCVALSASLPCPACGQPFGRRGLRLETTGAACAHCGANPRTAG